LQDYLFIVLGVPISSDKKSELMRDPRLDKLADVIVRHCAVVKEGDLVAIRAEPYSMPAVEALFEAVLHAGGHPSFHARSDALQEIMLRFGSDEQIQHTCRFDQHNLSSCDVLIVLKQPINTRFLSRIDPVKAALANKGRRVGLSAGMKRLASGEQRYVQTEIPGHAAAQEAEMSLTDYEDFVYRAGLLHLADPVSAWQAVHAQQQKAIDYLQSKKTLRFQAPANGGSNGGRAHEGTDLTVDVSGRKWLNHAGGANFPDGELDGGPRSVDGIVNFTHPSTYRGKLVDGIRLKFRDGRVVEASATKNEDYLIAMLDRDPGARVAGEIGIGTNYQLNRLINNMFFDEKIGGTFHLALGAGYPQTGNTNESGIHWDIVTDLRSGGLISADGEVFQCDGQFVFDGWPGGR
jgi:aminopeptidase